MRVNLDANVGGGPVVKLVARVIVTLLALAGWGAALDGPAAAAPLAAYGKLPSME